MMFPNRGTIISSFNNDYNYKYENEKSKLLLINNKNYIHMKNAYNNNRMFNEK